MPGRLSHVKLRLTFQSKKSHRNYSVTHTLYTPAVGDIMSKRSKRYLFIVTVLLLSLIFFCWVTQSVNPTESQISSSRYFPEIELTSSTHRLGRIVHQDARYASRRVPDPDHLHTILKSLLETYYSQMRRWNVETWIAHGTLLGWYWNNDLLPWDTDVEVQMTIESLQALAQQNSSIYVHGISGGLYFLDINPAYTTPSSEDTANWIDARWIDMQEGNFIDITAVRRSPRDELFCKDSHRYAVGASGSIFFLRSDST